MENMTSNNWESESGRGWTVQNAVEIIQERRKTCAALWHFCGASPFPPSEFCIDLRRRDRALTCGNFV